MLGGGLMNVSEMLDDRYCTGCGACIVMCPVAAISYGRNAEGFYSVKIDNSKCIDCGNCTTVCSKYIEPENNIKDKQLYAAWLKDQSALRTSSSGGIAAEIARYGIKNDYYVIGVQYDYKNDNAKTIIGKTLNEIEMFKGSKYLQSSMYPFIDEFVKFAEDDHNRKFIVFGTPCQIFGLRKLFEKRMLGNEIILIDLFCHGVPSYLVWEKYLEWVRAKYGLGELTKVEFRSKDIGWHNFLIKLTSGNRVYAKPSEIDPFYKCYFDNIAFNNCCKKCKFRKGYSEADIRLGDFWGDKYQINDRGVSAVLINSAHGSILWNEIAKSSDIIIETDCRLDDCVAYQSYNDYSDTEISEYLLRYLRTSNDIARVIKIYRKAYPAKVRIRKLIKQTAGYLPNSVRKRLRKFIKRHSVTPNA